MRSCSTFSCGALGSAEQCAVASAQRKTVESCTPPVNLRKQERLAPVSPYACLNILCAYFIPCNIPTFYRCLADYLKLCFLAAEPVHAVFLYRFKLELGDSISSIQHLTCLESSHRISSLLCFVVEPETLFSAQLRLTHTGSHI